MGLFSRWPEVFRSTLDGMLRQRGYSLIDLLVTMAIIATLAAIVTPRVLRARVQANDATAVVNLKAVQTAQTIYALTYPQEGFADRMGKLGDPAGQPPSAEAAGLIQSPIACPNQPCAHNGFTYEIYRTTGRPVALYWVRARPVNLGTTGTGTYHSMNDDKIAFSPGEGGKLSDAANENP